MPRMDLSLETRAGLPDALRILLASHPREAWEADPHFAGLVEMWLDRHLLFRRLMALMQAETEALLDRRDDPDRWGGRLSRLGSHFVGDLHGHHHVEDAHYFPLLVRREPRIEQGFDILDRDHKALDGHLAAFVDGANAALGALDGPDPLAAPGRFHAGLLRLGGFLDRHLTDEEEIVVPVILRDGPSAVGG